jgi:hypothetical protein
LRLAAAGHLQQAHLKLAHLKLADTGMFGNFPQPFTAQLKNDAVI